MKGPITSPMKSVCLSVYISISLTLSSERANEFFLIFGTIIDKFNNYKLTVPFFQESLFLLKFEQKMPKMVPK